MLGYTRDELRRRSWIELLPAGESPAENGLPRVACGEVEALCRERPLVGKDGRPIHVILAARAIPRRGAEVERVMVVVQDITDRRVLEEDTRRAKEAAEAAARAKSEFLAGMSHEFRTPLHSIFGMLDLVLEADVPSDQRAHLERARHGAESLLTLVNDVLDLSRIEAGKLTLRTRDFAVRPWLQATLEPLAFLAEKKGLELRSEVAAEVPEAVLGDPDRMAQVVVNLVANAIKFTDRGEVRVRVDTPKPGVARAEGLHIVVSDTGPGIPEAEQRAIFEPFTQAPGALDAATAGTGLGLAICSAIARLMAGSLWVESKVGAGSRFHFVARLTPLD
jgi:PAS domain S-box-containing protein